MPEGQQEFRPEQIIVRTKKDLPPLKEGFVRVIHLTHKDTAENIAREGLDYAQHGILSSTARSWGTESQVEYGSTDPRFSGLVVML